MLAVLLKCTVYTSLERILFIVFENQYSGVSNISSAFCQVINYGNDHSVVMEMSG